MNKLKQINFIISYIYAWGNLKGAFAPPKYMLAVTLFEYYSIRLRDSSRNL